MIRVLKDKRIKVLFVMIFLLLMFVIFMKPCYAAGDVSGAIESAWGSAKGQIKSVVNNVVFPVIDLVLAVFFFVKL